MYSDVQLQDNSTNKLMHTLLLDEALNHLNTLYLCPVQASDAGTVDLRHFAFYAFAGRTGIVRWTRKNEVLPLVLCFSIFSLGGKWHYV